MEQTQESLADSDTFDRSVRGLPLDEPTHAAKRHATFSAEKVMAAFAKWLKFEDLAEVILGPSPK